MEYKLTGSRRTVGILVLLACYATVAVTTSPTLLVDFGMSFRGSPYLMAVLVFTYLIRPFLAIPATPLNLFVGFVYGPIGFLVIQFGTVLSVVPSFVAGAVTGSGTNLSARFEVIPARMGSLRSVIVVTLLPIPLDVVGYAAGLARIRRREFFLGLFIGAVPWSVGQTLVGWSLQQYERSAGDELVWLVVCCSLLAVLAVVPMLYRRGLGRDGELS